MPCIPLLAILLALTPPPGAMKSTSKTFTAGDPETLALRASLGRAYRRLHGFRETVTQRQWESDPQAASWVRLDLRFERPNRIYLRMDYPRVTDAGRWEWVVACDGRMLTLYDGLRRRYTRRRAPDTLAALPLPQAYRGPELALLIADTDPFTGANAAAYQASYEDGANGSFRVLRMEAHQEGHHATVRYWLDPSSLLVRRLRLDVEPEGQSASPFLSLQAPGHVEAEYTAIEPNPRFAASDFAFKPPPGSMLVNR